MRNSCRYCLLSLLLCAGLTGGAEAENETEPSLPSIAEKTKGMKLHEGFVSFFWDAEKGSIYARIDQLDREMLYVQSLATGLGSNPVGLDRGKMGDGKIVRFHRIGPKVLMVQRNLRFRAVTENALEKRAVEESFAQSILWGGKVVAESGDNVLVDLTSLLLSDPKDSSGAESVVKTLADSGQGSFSLDAARSAVYLERCRAFPKNTEFESILTFSGSNAGPHVRQTTPTANSITLRQHHSFIELPEPGYRPRRYDVRSPSLFVTFADYASPLDAPLQQRLIIRHRLEKKDPNAKVSEAIEPIVYYVDAGAPKQIQEALIEGARWWDEAFQAAGFKNAFQVRILPPDANPLDVRYNVIQWVHRSTRGWSYGGSVVDPRTGEILKGHVTLGSLRVRQDQLLFNGLQSGPASVSCACCGVVGVAEDASLAAFDDKTTSLDVALARIRQLSAHEVGHTIGFMHNFSASTYGDRASVMDYPAPRVKIVDGDKLDLSDAYGVGIGEWDKLSVQFAYSQFPNNVDEREELDKLLQDAQAKGMLFLSDMDARPAGAAEPMANLWDNGSDPLEELRHVLKVRRVALDRFDPKQLPASSTTADIAEYFTPIYLHHRYQLQAVGKLIGGWRYEYGYVSGSRPRRMIAADTQKQAVDELLQTLHPKTLLISPRVELAIAPRPHTALRDRELLPSGAGRVFDPLGAARVATDLTLDELFQPERLARLSIHARVEEDLRPAIFLPNLVERIWRQSAGVEGAAARQIGRVVREALITRLGDLLDSPTISIETRAGLLLSLKQVQVDSQVGARDREEAAFRNVMVRRVKQVLERPYSSPPTPRRPTTPPGSPIGASSR